MFFLKNDVNKGVMKHFAIQLHFVRDALTRNFGEINVSDQMFAIE